MEQLLMNKREVAKALSISVRTLDKLIAEKLILARRIGRRVLFARRVVERFANDSKK